MISIKKLAILGGTFNPPHIGHLLLAQNALFNLKAEKIIFLTAGRPPHKDLLNSATNVQRFEMVKLLTKDNPEFIASDYELLKDKPCYTAETLTEIKKIYPDTELLFIVGLDSLRDFEKWYRPDIIFEKATIAVSRRGGMDEEEFYKIKKYYEEKYSAKIIEIIMPEIEISSSDIRRRVKAGAPIRYMTTKEVEEYIFKNNLYKGD